MLGAGEQLALPPDVARRASPFCKVCRSAALRFVAHTAECRSCGALLNYPYVDDATLLATVPRSAAGFVDWYAGAASRNHDNFTAMVRYALAGVPTMTSLRVLDYGGGGGQFACVMRSLYPNASVWITDAADAALLPQWRAFNRQIPFRAFPSDRTKFDVIFLNDVYEHVGDPIAVLRMLRTRLAPRGRIFIDTPRPSWLYPLLRVVAPALYRALLRGTVDVDHQQLWSRRALGAAVQRAGLRVTRYTELTEFTREADFYLHALGIRNRAVRAAGHVFHRHAGHLRAHNKVMALCVPAHANAPS